ncbi:MAG: RNA 2',3'-cyclic phosphodiesterase [Planctomycetota bacterium]
MRCFVALDVPAPVCNHLAEVTKPLRSRYDVKWVHPSMMHMTLVFAGELDDEAVAELADLVREVPLPPLSLRLERLGHFPPRGLPHVLWAGLGGDAALVTELQRELTERAKPLGIEREKRGFTPHITLGRVKSEFGALALVDELRALGDQLKGKPFAPTRLVLYRSELRPGGAAYTALVDRPVPLA